MSPVTVIFHRIGPYHFARLRAVGRLLPLVAIETSGADDTYAWDFVAGADGFERITLFEDADAQKQPACEVARRMEAALERIRSSVVVVPGWADAAALAALHWCERNAVPTVAMSESTEWDAKRSAWREALKRRIVRLYSAALVGGQPHKNYIVKLGMPSERVFLGYDAVDGEYFASEAQKARSNREEVRGKYGLPERYFLASARFVEKKNLTRLLQAYALHRENAEKLKPETLRSGIWGLVLLGDGPLKSDLCRLVSDLGLQHFVLLPGFKQYPDLPAYYGLAGAFVHASTTEQWGLVVNEAMASSLPVLVSNRCGCAQDLVQENANGFTFDPYSPEQLAQLMIKISTFQDVRLSALGDASRRIASNWGPERFASGMKAAVDKALEIGSRKAGFFDRMLLRGLIRR